MKQAAVASRVGRMSNGKLNPRLFRSIGFRISSTCWLVTLLTLALYLAVSVPQQKKDLLEALRSKARGVSSSLQDVTAAAAISDDFTTVVDHCLQMLRGDEAVEYLVITRNDGFSVVIERNSWRMESLDEFWRPRDQSEVAEIAAVPLNSKRVFRYAHPFEYSGIRWGWMNIGLSVAAYDQSVSRVRLRSIQLAIIGAGLSLLISLAQARRLVRPITTLQGVVRQVAGGNLSARAELRSEDEIEDLARAFNTMADTILHRNRVLDAVRFAGQQLLSADDWSGVVEDVLARIGNAASVSRAYLIENQAQPDGGLIGILQWVWRAEGQSPMEWRNFLWSRSEWKEWTDQLSNGEVVVVGTGQCKTGDADYNSVFRTVAVPIQVSGAWWGLLGFDDRVVGRSWGEAEKDSLRAVADMFGAAIARHRAKRALVDARDNLELRVLERTRELQQQVRAREEANAQLTEAQQRLIALSRQAGMAEVATGVLHNVGNVLNSVNVSATIVANKLRESRVNNLLALNKMLEEHSSDLPRFIREDPKGRRVLPYVIKLGAHLEEERQTMCRELELLTGHIGHIKQIVSTQQSYAKVSGLIETIALQDLADDAVRIVQPGTETNRIHIERDYEQVPPVSVDKHAVLQILLNLLRNAKQAIKDSGNPNPQISIRIHRQGEDSIRLSVADTGVGLPSENLTRIFSHGFTTRRDGHGFGLHSGANAAQQMGGTLWAESDGPGLGATFILELPLKGKTTAKGMQPV